MGRSSPIQMQSFLPANKAGQHKLAVRTAQLHADFVVDFIDHLDCSAQQKLELLQAVIDAATTEQPTTAL